ncbi:sensor histidine kinase [Nocardioides sp. Soil805]|uniref:sensor histidine kinase n=1 Tax=Nocardioides sp. Soil805 TaxID=1736416 RepID=UPI0007029439|nr:HAMP domain-containing sensor histidine kinase [Nocardioides sp. Soil805]KRF34749.1 histidine kinase [Nocardioides sp. Soil805]
MSSLAGWDDKRWHYRRSLASRVAVLTTLAVAVSIAAMSLGAFMVMRMQLQGSLDESLLDRAEKAAKYTALSQMTERKVPSWMLGAADVRIAFITAGGAVVTADEGPQIVLGTPEHDVAVGRRQESVRTIVTAGGVEYRVATVPAGPDQALVLAQLLSSQQRTLAKLGTVMLVAGGLGVLAAALAGWAVAANGLRPVRRLTRSVERIAVTEDLAPLAVEGDDEIARLAGAFNQMLTSLAASRDRQRRLVADAGHELRTPLTSLRTNLDLLAQADTDGGLPEEARRELLDDVRAQIEELTTLVGDLVVLAREDHPAAIIEPVDLAEVTERALVRVRRRAPGVDFDVRLDHWRVTGDATGLERAILNLLDNAAKWSPIGGTITVRLMSGVLTIDDQGPGIPAEDQARVFERFWRSDESRSMPGSGLGLAIVRQVVDRHGGRVAVDDAPGGGTRLTLSLPGEQPAHA